MSDGTLIIVLFVIFIAAVAAIPLYVLRQTVRQTRGTFGRPYGDVVSELMQESERRSEILIRLTEMREARIARLERRAGAGR